ncbi:hypothetical protein QWZ13_01895 [Reinekea marina]|uniref:Outer membrane protein beta-barrel domain-containing protein n=1 Tax=Reinekea marina TaxID=1310421 RepID=A0ABV7WNX2_9GAMM|nr:hypothetical protein [Reinekea marina]MDN3647658.1 hypothetical protein [Reinekea marina]
MRNQLMATLGCLMASVVLASPGAIDRYGCHKDSSNNYHCHGDLTQAKRIHTLVGLNLGSRIWFYGDGPANFFIGPSLETEVAFDALAVRGGYTLKPLWFGSSGYSLSGWDVGVKLGKGLSRLGKHSFLEVGYFNTPFKRPNKTDVVISGLQFGAGFILNTENWSFDGRITYRDVSKLEEYWNYQENIPTEAADYTFSVGMYRRF